MNTKRDYEYKKELMKKVNELWVQKESTKRNKLMEKEIRSIGKLID